MTQSNIEPAAIQGLAQPFIPVQATVQMDDIVSVRVASVEQAITELFEKNKMQLEEAKKALAAASDACTKLQQRDAKQAQALPVFKDLERALKAAQCSAKLVFEDVVTFSSRQGKGSLKVTFKQEESNYSNPTWSFEIPLSTDVKAASKKIDDCRKWYDHLQAESMKLIQARGKLGSIERAARASVAKQRLSQTTEGKKILSELSTSDPSTMLGLPAGTIRV